MNCMGGKEVLVSCMMGGRGKYRQRTSERHREHVRGRVGGRVTFSRDSETFGRNVKRMKRMEARL